MATTRALAAAANAGHRAARKRWLAVLSSSGSGCCRRGRGSAQSFSFSHSSSAEREREGHAAGGVTAATAAQVEAALNRKNVEVVQGQGLDRHSATLLPDDDADAAWVPDQETGVFVPADEASASGDGAGGGGGGGERGHAAAPSVLDQAVFVREEMEDVERPAIGTDAGAGAE